MRKTLQFLLDNICANFTVDSLLDVVRICLGKAPATISDIASAIMQKDRSLDVKSAEGLAEGAVQTLLQSGDVEVRQSKLHATGSQASQEVDSAGVSRKLERNLIDGCGIVIFPNVHRAMQGDRTIKSAGFGGRLIFPPVELRSGCDLAVEINLVERDAIERLLKNEDIPHVIVGPVEKGAKEPLNIVRITDFGNWAMVKAANMKLTYDKTNGIIVNISGGGCPDIPYLNFQLVGKRLDAAPKPRDLGFTLCAMMLDVALAESLKLWQEDK